jgi:hypothetical protein
VHLILFTNTTINGFGQNCSQSAIYTWNFGDGTPTITTPTALPWLSPNVVILKIFPNEFPAINFKQK